MQQIILRDDQQELKQATYADWGAGVQNTLNVLSTGGGKSIIMSDIILDFARLNKRQMVMAHRNELVSQMAMHVARRGVPHRVIGADKTIRQIARQQRDELGKSFVNPSANTAVVGVDTMIARRESLEKWAYQIDYWLGDEAHHFLKDNKWGTAVGMMPNAQGAGFTATPLRADGQGLGRKYDGVFDTLHVGPEMRALIEMGALSDYEIVCPKSDIDIDGESLSKDGDWSVQKLKKAAKKSHIVGDVVKAYTSYALGKQAICFATDTETAVEIAQNFNNHGIKAVALSAKTNSSYRDQCVRDFKNGKIRILVNVDLFDEGFDVPACEVVIMARPTASLGKYRQMVGRALRTAPGKLYGLIIDHVSNVIRHGLPDRIIPWTLARRDKRAKSEPDPDDIPMRECIKCTKPYEKFHTKCPYCGEPPPLPAPQDRSIKSVEGDLILLDRAKLEEMRKATEMENPADIGSRVGHVAGEFAARGVMNKQIEKIEAQQILKETIEQWAGCERAKGFDDRQIYKKFYLLTGADVLSAMRADQSRKDFEALTETVKGWYK